MERRSLRSGGISMRSIRSPLMAGLASFRDLGAVSYGLAPAGVRALARAAVAGRGRHRPRDRSNVRRAAGRRVVTVSLVALNLLAVSAAAQSTAAVSVPRPPSDLEDSVATYIVNIVRYSVWPPEALRSADAPYVITVLGDDAVRAALGDLAARAAVSLGRPIEVRSLRLPAPHSGESIPVEAIGRTHVVFVGRLAQP